MKIISFVTILLLLGALFAAGPVLAITAAPTPSISPEGGTFSAPQQVTIIDGLAGATIYYTTDGTAPTDQSPKYGGQFTAAMTETIRAIAAANGYSASNVALATLIIGNGATPTPTISPNGGRFSTVQRVTISDSLAGATIFYTTDGTAPNSTSPQYGSPITVSSSEIVKAFAYDSGYSLSGLAEAAFIVNAASTPTPTISPDGGTFSSPQQVTIADATPGAAIYYTTDGSQPTALSAQYNGPITVSSSGSVSAIAVAAGDTPSEAATVTFTINTPVHVFSSGLAMISVPSDYAGEPLDTVLGYAPTLAVWNPATNQYAVTPASPADSLIPGQGYWVRFPQTVTIESLGTPTSTDAPFAISLSPGWNMIGDPFPSDEALSGITVALGGALVESFAAATSNGVLGETVWGFDGAAYVAATQLSPYQGYWVYAGQSCTLSISTPDFNQVLEIPA